jgi:predicted TIM-barrel fold metal-dependent hydrolase
MEKFVPLFDYGSVNDDHRAAAAEISELIKAHGNDMLAELIKVRFNVVEPNRYDVAQSPFVKACKEHGLPIAIQGWIQQGEGPDAVFYPLICVNEDVRRFDEFYKKIKEE